MKSFAVHAHKPLLAVYSLGKVNLYDIRTMQHILEFRPEHVVKTCTLAFTEDCLALYSDYGCTSLYAIEPERSFDERVLLHNQHFHSKRDTPTINSHRSVSLSLPLPIAKSCSSAHMRCAPNRTNWMIYCTACRNPGRDPIASDSYKTASSTCTTAHLRLTTLYTRARQRSWTRNAGRKGL